MIFFIICFTCLIKVMAWRCGIDDSSVASVSEGTGRVENYPWLGIIYYPQIQGKFTTAVVLVTRQFVLASAIEIDKIPKKNFRDKARVILGHNCSGPTLGILDYTYHPDFSKDTFSALSIIQLEMSWGMKELTPICPPPSYFHKQEFFAMVLPDNCKRSKIKIHKMKYVSLEECKDYYRQTELDVDTLWPSHTVCAKSTQKGRCIWRSGAILTVKTGDRWRLLGFGVYGPGCEAPARFIDYGMYHDWVLRSVQSIGKLAITRLSANQFIVRRSIGTIARYGSCDEGEIRMTVFRDHNILFSKHYTKAVGTAVYNLTLVGDIAYTCIVLRSEHGVISFNRPFINPKMSRRALALQKRCFCAKSHRMPYLKVNIFVTSKSPYKFEVDAYGDYPRQSYVPRDWWIYLNKHDRLPEIPKA